jgi:hypothetical protein
VISLSEGELDKDALHETMAHPLQIGEAREPGGASRDASGPAEHHATPACAKRRLRAGLSSG